MQLLRTYVYFFILVRSNSHFPSVLATDAVTNSFTLLSLYRDFLWVDLSSAFVFMPQDRYALLIAFSTQFHPLHL